MSDSDARRWDERYADPSDQLGEAKPPSAFAHVAQLFPAEGAALEIACGAGQASVWLAQRGMTVAGYDVSPVAVRLAADLAAAAGVSATCSFGVHDLDRGLPETAPVDLVLCHMFRDPALDRELVDLLKPGGLLAIAALSEVGAEPGRFRARPGELQETFADLETLEAGEADGRAWLLGRRP